MLEKWYPPSKPGELRDTPWLHPALVAYIDMLIEPTWKILEHGSGGSSIWFAKRAESVVTVEHAKEWAEFIEDKAIELKLDNLDVVFNKSPLELQEAKLLGFDMVFIDGERYAREAWISSAVYLARPGGVVILDNSNRSEYQEARNLLRLKSQHFITFVTNPPGHTESITELYRMRGGSEDENWI